MLIVSHVCIRKLFFPPRVFPQLWFTPIPAHIISVSGELYNKYVHKYTVSELIN